MKRILNIAGFCFLLGHFGLLFIYCLPTNRGSSAKLLSAGYAYPLYEQGWNLFAPAPTSNYRFAYRTQVGKEWGAWRYPLDDYHEKHDKLAFSPSGRHTLAEYNLVFWIHSQLFQDYGSKYTSSLKSLDEQEQFKLTFAYKSYEKYVRYYSSIESSHIVQGKIDITDLANDYVHEIILPIVYEEE